MNDHAWTTIMMMLAMGPLGCSDSDASSELGFEEHACEFELPSGIDASELRCGTATVPLDWSDPEGEMLRVEAAVLKARGGDPEEAPLLFFGGGPGEPNLEGYLPSSTGVVAPIRASRDVVYFDPRGIGRSEPHLDCPEVRAATQSSRARPDDASEEAAAQLDAYRACHDRLTADGIAVGYHHTDNVARDAHAVMEGFGYARYHVYGISYGTRTALSAMRQHPEAIVSATLDSVLAPDLDWVGYVPRDFERALETMVTQCEASPACSEAYPDLWSSLATAYDALNASPHPLMVAGQELFVTGDRFLGGIHRAMYSVDFLPFVPQAISDTAAGDLGLINAFAPELAAPGETAHAASMSMVCADGMHFTTPEEIAEAATGVDPKLVTALGTFDAQVLVEVCAFWSTPSAPDELVSATTSDIPTLVLSGGLDPITPPSNGEHVAETLSRAQIVQFDGVGHGVFRSYASADEPSCAQNLVMRFLDAPDASLDTSCVASVPSLF